MNNPKYGEVISCHMYTDDSDKFFGMPRNTEVIQELADHEKALRAEPIGSLLSSEDIKMVLNERHRVLLGRAASKAIDYDTDELIAWVANGDLGYKEILLEKSDAADETMRQYDDLMTESSY